MTAFRELLQRALLTAFVFSLVLQASLSPGAAAAGPGERSPARQAQLQLESLSPAERVGQLFLISFEGNSTDPDSAIYQLITNYHIGGVVLSRGNDNFSEDQNEVIENTWALINNLQWTEYNSSRVSETPNGPAGSQDGSPAYIPLFISLSQEGDRSEHTEILRGVSPLPSQLAIGATWNKELARATGEQLGRELATLGVNMVFGPSLDVLSDPKPDQPYDLGVRSFGGDPFWVSQLGQAYISGIHQGSSRQVAVIGKYFPGLGSSDRLPDREIATVRKSLDQLKQTDLSPFFSVTGNAPSPEAAVDGLLNSHIRYQGLQGNIRSTTRPISLDPQALDLLMALEPLGSWRQEGGLLISDNLGSQSLRQLYDPTGRDFNIRQVALDAFIAGNDVLYLGNSGEQDQPLSLQEIEAVLTFFTRKYQEDQTFAERVDNSVLRILSLKYRLHEYFNITSVLSTHNLLSELGDGTVASEVARNSATLISPVLSDLNNALPNPPQLNDRMVILTDSAAQQLCSSCPPTTTLGVEDLEKAILRLYGPQSGRQVMPANIASYSYRDLINLLDFPADTEYLDEALSAATWIVVVSRKTSPDRPESLAVQRLLAERQDLIRGKTVIVFAMNAPYYLDATNISKLTAYFGIYSKLPPFVDVAARLLFREIPSPPGSLPVSVPGIGYDLITATSPDPDQVIPLYLGGRPDEASGQDTPASTPSLPLYNAGDVVVVETGSILDYNGNPVPDGTPVRFQIRSQGTMTEIAQVETQDGQASTSFVIEQSQDFELIAVSAPAQSAPVIIQVKSEENTLGTPEPTTTQIFSTLTPTPRIQATPAAGPSEPGLRQDQLAKMRAWFLSLLTIIAVSLFAYQIGALFGMVRKGITWGLAALISGLFAYNYLMLELPGTEWVTRGGILNLRFGMTVLIGSLLGWLAAFLYTSYSPSQPLSEQ
jgi:beta-N-acetylhexosaminidase